VPEYTSPQPPPIFVCSHSYLFALLQELQIIETAPVSIPTPVLISGTAAESDTGRVDSTSCLFEFSGSQGCLQEEIGISKKTNNILIITLIGPFVLKHSTSKA
jgi:hypothetical protein